MIPAQARRFVFYTLTAFSMASALALTACGGGGNATIGGTVSGLGAGSSVVLQDNNSDNQTVPANGTFSFVTGVAANGAYAVTVLAQPVGQTCSIANGSGTVDSNGDSVSNVAVTCTASSSLGGTVSGLAAGASVTLSNGGTQLPVAVNGAFAFPGILVAGTTYNVTVTTQPVGQTCTVTNPGGTIVANVMSTVAVACN